MNMVVCLFIIQLIIYLFIPDNNLLMNRIFIGYV